MLTLDNPEMRNAMSEEMTDSWVRVLDDLAADRSVRVVVVTGDVVVADRDGIVVVDPADWPEIEAEVRRLRGREEGIKAELAAGRRLGHVLGLDEAGR